ncbi:uncharacterized protein LOC121992057 [Zingiber officinale]|uniref:Uncharacterized protein n=1 Tax=Zingiber officinale TaxID=94328 RepID=A0A8J5HWT5_ZINOF|nr:uncharacterized protein LOC121992057 [Zingiber officinale]KAG6534983.1 hypothetical protein ZIOFF_008897 [Zingiber officinale]
MDESWRAPIGSVIPRRRSTEETRGPRSRWADYGSAAALGPDDFRDVFGGPPRTVLLCRFSGELHGSGDPKPGSFYGEILRPANRQRRIPRGVADGRGMVKTEEGFYDDIFGNESIGGQRSKSKSSSSSVLSSEDAMLSSFASKLRPIAIPSKGYGSSPSTTARDGWSIDSYPTDSYLLECKDSKNKGHSSNELLRQKSHLGFSCCFSPPETISLEASFRKNHDEPAGSYNSDDSPISSVISSAFLAPMLSKAGSGVEDVILELKRDRQRVGSSSYKIEADHHDQGDREGSDAIDEAIAWAKQKFRNHQEKFNSMNQMKEDPVSIC